MSEALRLLGIPEKDLPKTEADAKEVLQDVIRKRRDKSGVESLQQIFTAAKLL